MMTVRAEPAGTDAWLDVDCHAMVQALRYLGRRLQEEFGLRDFTLATSADAAHAYLDLCWLGARLSGPTAPVACRRWRGTNASS